MSSVCVKSTSERTRGPSKLTAMSNAAPKAMFLDSIPTWGGGEKWCVETARALGDRGLEVVIGCAPGSELEARAVGSQLGVWRIPRSGLAAPLASLKLSRFLTSENIDIVVANVGRDLRMGAVACALSGKVLVQRRGIARPVKRDLIHRTIYQNQVSMVVANCNAILDRMREDVSFLPDEKVRVIPNAVELVELSESRRASSREALGLAPDQIAVGMLGRLSSMKGLGNLLGAWRIVKQKLGAAQLFLAGAGEDEHILREIVKRLELTNSVHFLGFVREPSSMLSAMDLFVLPSIRDEGCSNAVLEAMSHALPCIVTNCGGLPELIESGRTGRVAPKNHADSLAEAISDLVTNEDLRKSMGERARAAVESIYSVEAVTAEWASLLTELTRPSAAGTSSFLSGP